MSVPARTWYLLIASIICLLFAGTGVFYLLNLQSPSALDSQLAKATPTPQAQKKTQEVYNLETNEESEADEEFYTCYDTCDYNFQCPNELECLDVSGENRCVDPTCPDNSTCDCNTTIDQAATPGVDSSPSAELVENVEDEEANSSSGFGGLADSTMEIYNAEPEVATPATTPTPTPKPAISQNLPAAGSQELTIAIFIASITLTTLGFALAKNNKS
jgi:hypothetical protein